MIRIIHFSFILTTKLLILKHRLFSQKKIVKSNNQSIAALPYYPKQWPGGEDRIAAWKPYFEKENIKFDVFWCWVSSELRDYFQNTKNNNHINRYKLFFKLLNRRSKIITKILKYDTIWIQRAFLPLFPYNTPEFEKLLKKLHKNVIYDYYDADYISNEKLVFKTVELANKVTVASKFLENKFKKHNTQTQFIRFAIKTDNFLVHKKKVEHKVVRIGWMGSPENAKHLLQIKEQLREIEKSFPFATFTFVCRNLPDLKLERSEKHKWGLNNFDYFEWLHQLDIGIVPFINQTDIEKAKISMKSLEFMANKVALISSPNIHSDKLENNKSFLLAEKDEWFGKMKELINSKKNRIELGEKGYETFINYHTYLNTYSTLKKVLLN